MDARHAVHHEALTGHLHQRRVAAGVQKLPERLLQIIALRGGVGRLLMEMCIRDRFGKRGQLQEKAAVQL